jgi:hypothetical protein
MVEIKTHRDHPASMAERINNRLKPSAGADAGDVQVTRGSSPNRTITTIHHRASTRQHGEVNRGEPGVDGKLRGPAAPLIGQLGEDKR